MIYRLFFLVIAFVFGCANTGWSDEVDDTAFSKGSGINEIWLHDDKVDVLANLGMVWGFIKYHHQSVTDLDYDMDARLFDVLPKVMAAKDAAAAYVVIERWVDSFGVPEKCKQCVAIPSGSNLKMAADYGSLFLENNLPQSLVSKLTVIKDNREKGKKQKYVSVAGEIGNPIFSNERLYAGNVFPDAGMRLLALYRYWNIIQYFCPNRHKVRPAWQRTLTQFIPMFCNAQDAASYQLTCATLVARINDTHGTLYAEQDMLAGVKGKYITPFAARFAEDKLVVCGFYKDTLGVSSKIKLGDVLEEIEGVSILDLIRKYLPLVAASNYEKKLSIMTGPSGYILRSNNTEASLVITRAGQRMTITVPRVAVNPSMWDNDFIAAHEAGGYRLLNGNVGYLYPAKMKNEDLEAIKDSFANTKGVIVDMRGYPKVFMTFDYGNWFKSQSSPFVQLSLINTDMPGYVQMGKTISNGGGGKKHYGGKVLILVNGNTHSSGEYQTMALQTASGAKVLGSKTSGADGDVSEINLPGGVKTMISGVGILYPDGKETQGAGVKIDNEFLPTVKAITDGMDEVLDAALRLIKE